MKTLVLRLLGAMPHGMPPTTLVKNVSRRFPGQSNRAVRNAIRDLVDQGKVVFSSRYGQTHLELSYHRSVPVSDRITVTSPRLAPASLPESLIIKINRGASFGMGDHPSTRTALRGVEFALPEVLGSSDGRPISTLDIGTGSGILAIAAVKLGSATADGLDLDPIARHEARLNARLNHLDHVISIRDVDLDLLPNDTFDVLVANLRTPTLKQIIPAIRRVSRSLAYWVFAGVRDAEAHGLVDAVAREKGKRLWQDSECGWSAMVFRLEKHRPPHL